MKIITLLSILGDLVAFIVVQLYAKIARDYVIFMLLSLECNSDL